MGENLERPDVAERGTRARRPATIVLVMALAAVVGAPPTGGVLGDAVDGSPDAPPPNVTATTSVPATTVQEPAPAESPTTTAAPPAAPATEPEAVVDAVSGDRALAVALKDPTIASAIAPPAPDAAIGAALAPVEAVVPFATIVAFLETVHLVLRFLDARTRPPGYVDLGNGVWGPGHLVAIRRCESGGNYGAVSRRGSFRGAYQFSQRTWNAVAASNGRHDLVGLRPNEVGPADQDQLATWNYEQSNPRRQWPVCSRRR